MRARRASERCINVRPLRIVFAGGGTGGHLFPALAIAEEIKLIAPSAEILFVGTKGKIEARVVPQQGYRFETIWISGFRRSMKISNLLFPLKVLVALMQSNRILSSFRPDAVVGTGGYVSGPVVYTAALRGIPTLIHEQNSFPGATTRFLGKRVDEVHCSFERSLKYFRRADNVFMSGNPTRRGLENADRDEALRYFGITASGNKTILIFGGSLGAHAINRAVGEFLPLLVKEGFRLLWQTGQEDFPAAEALAKPFPHQVWVKPFIDRMDYAYAVSDLVVCRAGATTIAELTRLGKPAILIPYPHAAADHQTENARAMAEQGAAEIVEDAAAAEKLMPAILAAAGSSRLRTMADAGKRLGNPAAAHTIAVRVLRLAGVQ
jgi:UDP-N-acetylglucosamine--N-acetylmuramyl-(pentapeptide) pyrophosphoryl-undecaprenol N-acetylglucosamine transferase